MKPTLKSTESTLQVVIGERTYSSEKPIALAMISKNEQVARDERSMKRQRLQQAFLDACDRFKRGMVAK